jgi:hypothetical protein
LSRPRWNFHKYLINRDGTLKAWFGSLTSPKSAKFNKALDALIAGRRGGGEVPETAPLLIEETLNRLPLDGCYREH